MTLKFQIFLYVRVCTRGIRERNVYFIEGRRRLSSLRGPVMRSQLGVDRSLLFFSALLRT